ncbi:MAG: DNA-binding response regulator [Rubrivivax sp.]|nr:DNA-binding response regulator [Rubrivivax sp.]
MTHNPGCIVLLVDDVLASVGPLAAALQADGCTVLLADSGEAALRRLDLVSPDAIVLDAAMPGLSGFDTCRRIKADPSHQHMPVIFMTGLSETADIVEGFDAGGVDYVLKPVRAAEVLARLFTHVRNARTVRMARRALDIGGLGVLLLDARGRVAWQSPQAQQWLAACAADPTAGTWAQWLAQAPDGPLQHRARDGSQLMARRLGEVGMGESMWLLTRLAAADGPQAPTRLAIAALTPRETEVLSWVAKGKTNRDVGDILGLSPRTVNKHLEHVFEKLGVETRAAAAALASRELG